METSRRSSSSSSRRRRPAGERARLRRSVWPLLLCALACALLIDLPGVALAAAAAAAAASAASPSPASQLAAWEAALWSHYEDCSSSSHTTPHTIAQATHTQSTADDRPPTDAAQRTLSDTPKRAAGRDDTARTAGSTRLDDGTKAKQTDDAQADAAAAALRARGRPLLPAAARGRPLLTLVMIVKNEFRSLAATLNSVLGAVDRYSIVDTGSTDGSVEFINGWFRKHLESDQYALHHAPFVDFSTTRNLALRLAGNESEFILFLNGDDRLVKGRELRAFLEQRRFLRGVDESMYIVPIDYGGLSVGRSERLSRSSNHFVSDWPNDDYRHWRYEGVTHEVYVCQEALQTGVEMIYTPTDSFHIYHDVTFDTQESKRERFKLDVELLLREIQTASPDGSVPANRARSIYYLAQSYYNLGDLRSAAEWYQRRVHTNYPRPTPVGSDNEKARSYSMLASISGRMGGQREEVERYLLQAHAHCPTSHTLFQLASFYTDAASDKPKATHYAHLSAEYVRDPSKASLVCGDDRTMVAQQITQLMHRIKKMK